MEDDKVNQLGMRVEVLEATIKQVLDILESLMKSATPARDSVQHNAPATLQLVSVSTKPTESNSSWTKWAWKLVVKNNSSKTILFLAQIQFRDADSFALDEQVSDNFRIAPLNESIFTGYRMVDASIANLVESVYANITVVG